MRAPGGVEWPECADSLRRTDGPGDPNGALVKARVECVGEMVDEPRPLGSVSNLTAVADLRPGEMDFRPLVGVLEKLVRPEEGGGSLSGSGNKWPLFFLRLFNLKNVVVVDMVCVVVVWA